MFHVVANIDTRFPSAKEALDAYRGKTIYPAVPVTRSPEEDAATPRICVCEDIRGCFAAIGLLGRFRRCLAANEDAKSYETTGREVYPILILHFSDELPYYSPNASEVPDVEATHERWLKEPATPDWVKLAWVHPRSIVWEYITLEGPHPYSYLCKDLEILMSGEENGPYGRIHPWLTGSGHCLDSGLMEDEYELNEYVKQQLVSEIEDDDQMERLEDTPTGLMAYDFEHGKYVTFHTRPLTLAELESLIHFGPSVKENNRSHIAKVLSGVDPLVLMNLRHILIIQTMADLKYLCKELDLDDEFIPENLYDTDDDTKLTAGLLGVSWFYESSVVINLQGVQSVVDELWYHDSNQARNREYYVCFWETLLHEIRHIQVDCCPYPMPWLRDEYSSEKAVEEWARNQFRLMRL